MTKQETLERIATILAVYAESDDECSDVTPESVFDQMPISFCELSHDASFTDLVRFAAHDVSRARVGC